MTFLGQSTDRYSSSPWRDPEDDSLRLECGVFGVFGVRDAAAIAALGLHALQHRGQEACGIAAFDGNRFHTERHMGHVGDAFTGADLVQRLPGNMAIGHTRYSTAGGSFIRNVQPMFADLETGGVAIAHNGNLTNFLTLRERLVQEGAIFQSTSDSEAILHLIARSRKAKIVDRFVDAISQIEGGYALVAITNKKMIGVRDPLGIRPLVLGDLDGKPVLASETCALDMIGARFVRDIEHGEMVVIEETGITSTKPFQTAPARPCVFEYVYFARPDSVVNGRSVYGVRKRMGMNLAKETGVEADVVVPVPDSGVPAALGYAQQSGLPFEMGIIRNHYVGRTFIQPTQGVRELGVRMKHSPNRAVLAGKRVVLIDDSIVRGTTSLKIVRMVREAGAKEVHLRSASPPIKWPDFYGIDMPEREQLLAANKSLEEMARFLEVDSLGFLSVDGLYDALEAGQRDPATPQFTDHYFTGDYPTRLTDREIAEGRNETNDKQLSLLVSA
ncbi:amidophosphoribosyltransferase [Caulobacter vibrioides]|uniref:Amidophosphoribosyltransferase n=2 Tax=Caulobacter vibrioides TaxID=155892 RepID=Q9A7R2_CAUVC|nr:amidophosphoribosyltransferase [Caulobacter vibrioides]YP_002517103.1 amidophosphoribosyltransferase [Caulobacter vibrioides NA1000]AAK23636.1 amidophosphoribosyltransferase [Caulobacter vibrioides CB15]ACL95195.1 amidophosphoribosyltransferase [Caulobacter vibrioides NA1000]ATC24665.1 amidophosphoribosyltransferase [Caulobacter vibrioides]ATC28540.1 amidophosphoribosyltransferase [Caulobacter vibrioides]AZH12806.1 amidophosphoribosyltransferase [Caulobacter vibrioides]